MHRSLVIETYAARHEHPSLFEGLYKEETKSLIQCRLFFEFYEDGTKVFDKQIILNVDDDQLGNELFIKDKLYKAYNEDVRSDQYLKFTDWNNQTVPQVRYQVLIHDYANMLHWLINNQEEQRILLGFDQKILLGAE